MTPAEQVFMMMQQLSADQQQAVLNLVQSFQSSPIKASVNHAVIDSIERQDPARIRAQMWGDDEM